MYLIVAHNSTCSHFNAVYIDKFCWLYKRFGQVRKQTLWFVKGLVKDLPWLVNTCDVLDDVLVSLSDIRLAAPVACRYNDLDDLSVFPQVQINPFDTEGPNALDPLQYGQMEGGESPFFCYLWLKGHFSYILWKYHLVFFFFFYGFIVIFVMPKLAFWQ